MKLLNKIKLKYKLITSKVEKKTRYGNFIVIFNITFSSKPVSYVEILVNIVEIKRYLDLNLSEIKIVSLEIINNTSNFGDLLMKDYVHSKFNKIYETSKITWSLKDMRKDKLNKLKNK